ncbi:MAG: SagB/ThcOx family dehydrogenase [Nitrospirota bacterium]
MNDTHEKKSIAEIYHQETKYAEHEMSKHERRLNLSQQPSVFKDYHSESKIDLVPDLPFQNHPFTGEPMQPAPKLKEEIPIERGKLSRLLYFTNGVTGILRYPDGQSLFLRAAPTAGGLYPTEIYVAIRNCSYLQSGIYNFQVKDHSLVLAWEGDYWNAFEKYCMGNPAIAQSDFLIILTAIYERSSWRYSERAYRRILLDTGHVLGNLMAYAPEEGLTPHPIASFFDVSLNALLYLDPSKEGVLSVVAFPSLNNESISEKKQTSFAIASESSTKRGADSEIMLQMALHRASFILEGSGASIAGGGDQAPSTEQFFLGDIELRGTSEKKTITLPDTPLSFPEGLRQTILTRRSTRRYSGEAFLEEELSSILEYGYRHCRDTSASFFSPALLTTCLIVQKVVGISPGIYQYAPIPRAISLLKPGDFRLQTTHFCLGQDLGKNAAALVVHLAHFPTALRQYNDRAYRYLHLDAGHIGERMNLAAVQMGLGASGIGGFYDDEVNDLIGLSLDWIVVYITTLGRP